MRISDGIPKQSYINVNSLDYEKYVARREVNNKEHQKVQTIEDEVANMKDDINEIKVTIKGVINGSNNINLDNLSKSFEYTN